MTNEAILDAGQSFTTIKIKSFVLGNVSNKNSTYRSESPPSPSTLTSLPGLYIFSWKWKKVIADIATA